LEMPKSSGGVLDITMLRPLEWLGAHDVVVGGSVALDMPELGAQGNARVLGVYPCPEIKPGPGQVITATFAHPSTFQVLDVTIGEGDDAETIGVTDTHPFWSETHQAFVPVGKLSLGDELLTLHGQKKRLTALLPRPGPPERVYNLEVHGEHTYYVGHQQLLVHNNGCKAIRLGVHEHIDEFGNRLSAGGIATSRFGQTRFNEIAENGISPNKFAIGPSGYAVQEKYVRAAIKNSDSIHFNLQGMSPAEFGKFVDGKSSLGYWTNMELKTILDEGLLSKVTFYNGNIDDFLKVYK